MCLYPQGWVDGDTRTPGVSDQALLIKWIGSGSTRSSVSKTKWRVIGGVWGDQVCLGRYGYRQKKTPKLTSGLCKPSVGILTPLFSDVYQFPALQGYVVEYVQNPPVFSRAVSRCCIKNLMIYLLNVSAGARPPGCRAGVFMLAWSRHIILISCGEVTCSWVNRETLWLECDHRVLSMWFPDASWGAWETAVRQAASVVLVNECVPCLLPHLGPSQISVLSSVE